MSTNTGYNDNNNNNNYHDKGGGGNSMLNYRKLRLSVYMVILLCAAVPNCIIFGNAINDDQCPTDDENSRDCNAAAAGWYLLMLGIVIVGFFLWVIPNSASIVDNNIAKVIFAFIIAIAAIMLLVAVFLSYDEQGCTDDPSDAAYLSCLSYFGYEWFVFCHAFLLAIDIGSDFGSDINKRVLTYSISYFIGCCILFEPIFENDDPSEFEEVQRAGMYHIILYISLHSLHISIVVIDK